jgi:hypothetical protein
MGFSGLIANSGICRKEGVFSPEIPLLLPKFPKLRLPNPEFISAMSNPYEL